MIRVSNLDGAPRDRPRGRMEKSEKLPRLDRGPSGSSLNYRTYATFVRVNHLTIPPDVRCFFPSSLFFSFASSSSLTLRLFRLFRFLFPPSPPARRFVSPNSFYFLHVLAPFRKQHIPHRNLHSRSRLLIIDEINRNGTIAIIKYFNSILSREGSKEGQTRIYISRSRYIRRISSPLLPPKTPSPRVLPRGRTFSRGPKI